MLSNRLYLSIYTMIVSIFSAIPSYFISILHTLIIPWLDSLF